MTRTFRPLRDLPSIVWLAATAVSTFVHPWVPAPRWLMLHLLLLGAVSHAVLVWSRFFADALLKTPGDGRAAQDGRLLALNAGVVGVVAGVLSDTWPLTLVGAAAVAGAVLWHAWTLVGMLRRALPARFASTVHYYVAAACLLPVGAVLGTLLARGPGDPWHLRLVVAHAALNLLGWVGLTIVGTLVTLWPTMLRTRMTDGAERWAARALPVLVGSVLVTAVGSLVGLRPVMVIGLLCYLTGLGLTSWALVDAARRRLPTTFAPLSVAAGVLWWFGCLVALAWRIATAGSWAGVETAFGWLTPYLAAGFVAQVLLGALAHLVPVALGGGPRPVRAATAELDRGAPLRVALANAGLLLCVVPVPSLVRVLASLLVLGAYLSWLPLLVRALGASRRAKHDPASVPAPDGSVHGSTRPRGQFAGMVVVGLGLVVLAAAAGVSVDPASVRAGAVQGADGGVRATGETTTIRVVARDMRYHPATLEVPAGDRLVVELVNESDDVHDLVLETGQRSPRVSPGDTTTLDVGVVGRDVEGWCSLLGHRQMGMVLEVRALGAGGGTAADDAADDADADPPAGHAAHGSRSTPAGTGAAADLDFMADAPEGFTARDASLQALPPGNRVHRRTFRVTDTTTEVAPGVTQTLWTYEGTAPGPTLHGRVGDRFVITLVNDGSLGHSVDFHASFLSPQPSMRTIAPGEKLVYRFTANRAGVWMYHCSTMPMSAHIANGLFGAVVIEPDDLPAVDRSYVLVQSELYLGEQGGEADATKLAEEDPDAVVFNGYANQYAHDPLEAHVGERVRIWVLDAGPNRPSSFHVIGSQFDTTWFEGAYLLRPGAHAGGSQALGLQAAQGGFVELTFPEPGDFPFVSHLMVDAERGAKGLVRVTR
ncbi:MAG: multicopper oxidase domain-containing protein [Nocardioides sp.]|uniref:multicopper oxidase domain-containing protein n=1 Tax=Nocardioides sp. TaxID=35761 RepID=UPI003F0243BD